MRISKKKFNRRQRLKAYALTLIAFGIYACAPEHQDNAPGSANRNAQQAAPNASNASNPKLDSSIDVRVYLTKNCVPRKQFSAALMRYRVTVKAAAEFLKSNGEPEVSTIIANLKAAGRSLTTTDGANGLAYQDPELDGYVRFQVHQWTLRVAKHHEKAVGAPLFSRRLSDRLQDSFDSDQKQRGDLETKANGLALKKSVLFWGVPSKNVQDIDEYIGEWAMGSESSSESASKTLGLFALLAHEREFPKSKRIFDRLSIEHRKRLGRAIDYFKFSPLAAVIAIDWNALEELPR